MSVNRDLALALQYALPHRLLCWVVRGATRWRFAPFKNALIRHIVRRYKVNIGEAEVSNIEDFEHFDAFFTRALKPGARQFDAPSEAIISPCDGAISEIGALDADRILQAKGMSYKLSDLLVDTAAAKALEGGQFATLYLSPRDYHRLHMPFSGRLHSAIHVPGRLFSVAPFAVEGIPGLFARNERLVCLLDTEFGPVALVMVGALLVSGMETPWGGWFVPPYGNSIQRRSYDPSIELARGEEFGRFHMGSTIIVITPPGAPSWLPEWSPGHVIEVGNRLA